ncbi:hypothetical protein M3Y98_01186900 [Aphelenchoides besseyi]|nr:hypothetical protein M3Y98_01186900 [Aphelenchoides besseyi]KAI6195257.1 hypothetical protein M3Y96_01211600 [Aphelenchoides besseyi]
MTTTTSTMHVPLLRDQDSDHEDVERGGPPSYEQVQNDGARFMGPKMRSDGKDPVALADASIRLGFLRKVLGILSFQFAATVILCAALYLTPVIRGFVQQQSWLMFVFLFGSIGVLFAMFVHAYNAPLNYFLLGIWTVMQALTVATVVTFYDLEVVLQALFVTVAVVGSLFVYTMQSKHDWRKSYALLASMSIAFIVGTLLQIVLMSSTFNFLMSLFGAALFSLYLIFDIDMVMNYHSEEDYIIACITIYMDVINLFLQILQIIAQANRN